jgi:hypothetical protein
LAEARAQRRRPVGVIQYDDRVRLTEAPDGGWFGSGYLARDLKAAEADWRKRGLRPTGFHAARAETGGQPQFGVVLGPGAAFSGSSTARSRRPKRCPARRPCASCRAPAVDTCDDCKRPFCNRHGTSEGGAFLSSDRTPRCNDCQASAAVRFVHISASK